jgi:hypothetical protein
MASKYRGRIERDGDSKSSFLSQVFRIIASIVVLRCNRRALRTHKPLVPEEKDIAPPQADEPESERDSADNGDAPGHDNPGEGKEEKKDGGYRAPCGRLLPFGPMGEKEFLISTVRTGTHGLGPEPDDSHVDHGHRNADLAINERVLVFWWGCYWYGTVRAILKRSEHVTIKWQDTKLETTRYPTRLLLKL